MPPSAHSRAVPISLGGSRRGGAGGPPSPTDRDFNRASPESSLSLDFATIRRDAELLAKDRSERAITTHVLIVLTRDGGLAGSLLAERRIGPDKLVKALRVAEDSERDPIEQLLRRARDSAGRAPATSPSGRDADAPHVLLAICNEATCAAHKTLNQLGVDLARLRAALMQQVSGSIGPRRRASAMGTAVTTQASERSERGPLTVRGDHADRVDRVEPKTLFSHPPQSRMTTLRPLPSRLSAPPPAPAVAATPSAPVAMPFDDLHALVDASRAAEASTADLRPALEERAQSTAPRIVAPASPPVAAPRHAVAKNVRRPRAGEGALKAPSEPTRFDLDPRATPMLAAIGVNLSAAAARGALDPVVGRDTEIDRALDVLAKRNANNPCLVGAPGVGKTAIAHGVAQRIASQRGVAGLDDRIVVEVSIGELLAGTGVRGALAERLGVLRREVMGAHGRIVVFLDEIHALLGGDAGEEAANELKTALARGELPCIGATTPAEYRRSIERDPALARRFSVVEIGELDLEAAHVVVDAASRALESHHAITFDPVARRDAVAWTVRYIPARALPDKALAALDLAGARAKRNGRTIVTREALAEVVAEMADVPVARLLERDAERFLELEKHLSARVVGHTAAIAKIARALRRGAAGLRGRKPLLSALLLGPTGVGKTETAKAIAHVLFDDANAMTRIDLSEFSEPHSVARLLGAPPGYVGHEDGGQLTESVRRRPYQVVLFDEMEKAHRDVLESLLQLLDEGRMTDGRGRTVDFTNTVVVLTSNLGSSSAADRPTRKLGFSRDDGADDAKNEAQSRDERIVAAARAELAPELFNRFDEVLVFAPLTRSDALAITKIAIAKLADELLKARGLELQADDEALALLLDGGGFDPSLGGRPIRREVSRKIEAPLAELLLRGEAKRGDVVWITVEEGEIVVDLVR